MAKKLVKNYVFSPGQGLSDNLRPNAYSLITQNRTFIIKEIVAYIQNRIDAADPDYVGYTYNTAKCERDAGYVIDALLFDLRYGGNQETRRVSSTYWQGQVPQIDGNRVPEYEAYQFARDLINTYILTNTADTTPEQVLATQVIDLTKTTESSTTTRVSDLLDDIVSVIENGLGFLPVLVVGLGGIEVLGKVGLQDLLIITNVTDNVVIYNFADETKGGQITFRSGNSENYPQAEAVNNGTTLINFNFNTSSMNSTDEVQLFLEESELSVRLNNIANDAMERVRVGIPQAMLDADFEYGLQPTKWQAIATSRGYPSTYEIPASEILVSTITTDASSTTGGVGASVITVTTPNDHGLGIGDPITIRALASSILGFNRAEGTFLINSVPTTKTFTYIAKSKVGTSNGQLLATSTTQLRRAGFYTGANVGSPTVSISSNGSSGTFNTALIAPLGSTFLTFVGAVPPIGAPLSGTGISTGTQVTATFGPSNSDGIVDLRRVQANAGPTDTQIDLVNVTDIVAGMAVNNGSSTQIRITSISGNTLFLSGALGSTYAGDEESYSSLVVSLGNSVEGTGSGATFDISVTSDTYSIDAIANGGSGYLVGDFLRIPGNNLGGAEVDNDLFIVITTVSSGVITGAQIANGLADQGSGTGSFSGVAAENDLNEQAANGSITLETSNGTYSPGAINDAGTTGYYIGNRFKIFGTSLGGTSPANDAVIRITSVSSFGGTITGFEVYSGTAVLGSEIAIFATVSISEAASAEVPGNELISYSAIAQVQVEFETDHGLVPGQIITVDITSSGTNHELAAGPFFINQIISPSVISYIARSPGTIDTSIETIQGIVYTRSDAFFTHRPFDGGVQLGTGGPQHGSQAIRMSKKYIRYQSGKGAMYNTGALFAPSFDISSITSTGTTVGSTITVNTDDADHGLQSGAIVVISGVETTGYDGEYTVSTIINERSFTVIATTQLGSATGEIGSQCQIALKNWHGAAVRSGPFDDQNGIFWEYDGQKMYVVRRTSTFQLAGTIQVNANSNLVTGTNTRFLDQLQEGDRIVLRGMTHVVANITNNTSMIVTPDFRGVSNVSGVKIAKVQDLRIPQEEWNLDRCDGTGPSGYIIDVTKMQMIGIQFTWYGAGFIDWMLRGPDGNYIFAHRLKGNNLNTEAYMRTGNLPVRYEVTNEGSRSRLNGSIDDTVTTITLDDVKDFPNSGVIYVDNEIISYSGKNNSTNQLTGCTRSASLTNFAGGSSRSYTAGEASSHNDNQGVVLISNTTSPIISHWGSAYLIDGQFDSDRGYIFNYAARGLSATTTKQTTFFIRLAPSVSNAVVGDLGERELLNRAQLLLQAISITSDTVSGGGAIVIEGILNPSNYPVNPTSITWNGLQGQAGGGQPSFAQIALGGSVTWEDAATTEDATVQGAVASTITARAFGTVTQTLQIYATSFGRAIRRNARFLYTRDSDVDSLSTTLSIGDILSNASNGTLATGTRITQINRSNTVQGGISYTQIVIDRNPSNESNTSPVTITVTSSIAATYVNAVRNNRSNILVTTADWNNSGAVISDSLSNVSFMTTARTINSINRNFVRINGTNYTRLNLSGNGSSNSSNATDVSMTLTANQTAASYTNTNYLMFTAASWEASGATLGTAVDATETSFPAGTLVNSATTRTLGATTFYRVGFSQSSNTTINATDAITFTFGAEYALPGEQVFSFIANPGETETLDLTELKELGTTAIGGRGTFPNGPDVLAINVFKVSGSATPVNLILRWGEAQA